MDTNTQTKSIIANLKLSLEELIRTSPSFLAFDPNARAQFIAKIELLDEQKKAELKQILVDERATISALDKQEAEEKAKSRQKIVDKFEIGVMDVEKEFQRNVVRAKEESVEKQEQKEASNLLKNLNN